MHGHLGTVARVICCCIPGMNRRGIDKGNSHEGEQSRGLDLDDMHDGGWKGGSGSKVSSSNETQGTMSIPNGLSNEEKEVYRILEKIKNTRDSKRIPATRLLMISDLAKDYDDLTALVVLKELERVGLIKLEGVVANFYPADKRAQFAKGALKELNMPHVPVGKGLDASTKVHEVHDYEFDCPFMTGSSFEDGQQLLKRLCTQNRKKHDPKLTLLCISSLTDAAQFVKGNADLAGATIDHVVLQGGYAVSADGRSIKAAEDANNNKFDMQSAHDFHEWISSAGKQSTVYTKNAAYSSSLDPAVFSTMAKTGNPVGIQLKQVQTRQDEKFYIDACNPATRLQPFMDQEWFLKSKTNWYASHSERDPKPSPKEVLDYTQVIVYDAIAALGAAGQDVVVSLDVVTGMDNKLHQVVGKSPQDSGVKKERMTLVLGALLKGSLLSISQRLD